MKKTKSSRTATKTRRAKATKKFGDTALEYGTYSTLIRQPNGPDSAASGKYLAVWRRQADGQWLIHADIASESKSPQKREAVKRYESRLVQ